MDAQVVSLLSAEFLASKDGGKHHMLRDLWQYNFYVNMNKHKSLCCLLCPTSTFLTYNVLMGAHKDFQDSVFSCESSLPSTNHPWISCMTNIVIVKPQKISLSKPNVKLPLGMKWRYNLKFMIFNSFNNLLTGYKWSTRVNDKLLQKDISEDHANSYVNG